MKIMVHKAEIETALVGISHQQLLCGNALLPKIFCMLIKMADKIQLLQLLATILVLCGSIQTSLCSTISSLKECTKSKQTQHICCEKFTFVILHAKLVWIGQSLEKLQSTEREIKGHSVQKLGNVGQDDGNWVKAVVGFTSVRKRQMQFSGFGATSQRKELERFCRFDRLGVWI